MKGIVQTQMEKAFNYYAPSVPMTVSAEVGQHWIH
jgi:DNA polymerase I-like protein with 3'-5' exonuclease and polymerase domains